MAKLLFCLNTINGSLKKNYFPIITLPDGFFFNIKCVETKKIFVGYGCFISVAIFFIFKFKVAGLNAHFFFLSGNPQKL